MALETVSYLDTPVELEVDGKRCQYAPMRMEWSFDPDNHPLEEQLLTFELPDEEPAVLQIHVTEGCNLRCSYCSHFENEKKGSGTLREEEIVMLLEEVKAMPPHGVLVLHGGEPFTVPNIVFRFVEASPVTTVIYTNGTLITVRLTALPASGVVRANEYARYPAITRQTAVSPRIHPGDMSRSRSSDVATARDAASVLTSPPTTGFASRASV